MKKEVAIVSIWSLIQATPFIGWQTNPQELRIQNQLTLPATIISQPNKVKIIKANKREERQDKRGKQNQFVLEAFENMINDLEEEPRIRGKTDTTQLGLVMMNMAGTILLSDQSKGF
ncbi:hypothetical protein NG861_00025 [Enterococcus faecalis]|uniref:hypothetical protein n=1 Tax=Enterococcus faecalis TaxID=1351 RepID=UPI002091A16D|nr:hypothetical protein [Enterococcus faecalis]MCO5486728.1 hypothetical protein [Enterococcus faecalis]HDT8180681.1 hypothetical protein [Enterococcus faecalis]HDV0789739.1 hypothetical protein [Enterococcus faecalis]